MLNKVAVYLPSHSCTEVDDRVRCTASTNDTVSVIYIDKAENTYQAQLLLFTLDSDIECYLEEPTLPLLLSKVEDKLRVNGISS